MVIIEESCVKTESYFFSPLGFQLDYLMLIFLLFPVQTDSLLCHWLLPKSTSGRAITVLKPQNLVLRILVLLWCHRGGGTLSAGLENLCWGKV